MRKEAGRETILCLSDWRRSTGFFPLGGFLVVPALRLLGLDLALFPFFLSFFFFLWDGRMDAQVVTSSHHVGGRFYLFLSRRTHSAVRRV